MTQGIAGRWLVDFASCNYLGFDLDPEIIEGIAPYLRDWGTHPSWSRMLGSPELYERIEDGLAELLGAADVLALPTLTHIHGAVLPILAVGGAIFLDARAHKTIYDGCTIARGRGAALHRFAHGDADELERLLRGNAARGDDPAASRGGPTVEPESRLPASRNLIIDDMPRQLSN
jgi:8-amino-7-oxononanoate synthase